MTATFRGELEFLSNYYPVRIEYGGIVYPSTEHAYQAQKTNDPDLRLQISKAPFKGIKRMVKDLRPDWEEVKVSIMKDLIELKFGPLAQKLLDTDPMYLEEGNYWHDNFWGNCSCPRCSTIVGQNVLGKLLMKRREILKEIL